LIIVDRGSSKVEATATAQANFSLFQPFSGEINGLLWNLVDKQTEML